MGLVSELRTLYHIAFGRVRGGTHAERLESFYRGQADGYDDFRKRLLHGREEMMAALEVGGLPDGATLLDLGGGTGANLEALGARVAGLGQAVIVDLCPALLERARARIERNGWTNVRTQLADVTALEVPEAPVDAITFSYSLTMIPNWFSALERAMALLKPGGVLGVVDFYVARKWPGAGMRSQSALGRWFWRSWFANDNVFLSPDHLPWLQAHLQPLRVKEGRGRVPYLLGLKAPYYLFVGRKPLASEGG